MTEDELKASRDKLDAKIAAAQESGALPVQKPTSAIQLIFSWLIVGIPLGYGTWQTVLQTFKMFR